MRVCHIISAFQRYDTRIFWKQCRSLVRAGYEVILITNDNLGPEIREGIKIIPSGFNYSSKLKRILFSRSTNYSKAIETDADLYQIHDPEFIPLGLKLKRRGKSVVYDSHEDFPRQILEKDWIPKIFRILISVIAEFYLRRSLKKFDAIFTVTPHIAMTLAKVSKNVHVVTNYPSIEDNFVPFTEVEYMKRGNKLCYAGTVYRSSLQQNIFQAIADQDNLDYIIVGTIDDKYKNELTASGFFKRIQFIEHVPKEALNLIYSQVSVGLAIFDYSPNLGYKTGSLGVNKIFEYMYFGLPVICTDFILWKEIIDKYKCGIYVNPRNIAEIANAIKFLFDNKQQAFEMGQKGRMAVLSEYNWNTQEKVYLHTIDNI
jgi:glycosyltransferase involved in cell wall biosynthesis